MVKEDFAAMAKKEFDELTKQKEDVQAQMSEIERKLKPLTAYMQAVGLVKAKRRGRRPKEVKD